MDNEQGKEIVEKVKEQFKDHRKMAVLSYLWILCIIPLLISKDEFVKFHARQGFILFLIEIVLAFIAWIPFIGWLLSVVVIIVVVMAIIKTLNGEKWEIPYVYEWSQKIKI
jgi:uncharacterized membrane protein